MQDNKQENHGLRMGIMMMLCCMLPILIIAFLGASVASPWLTIGVVAAAMLFCFFMMRGHSEGGREDSGGENKASPRKHHGCH